MVKKILLFALAAIMLLVLVILVKTFTFSSQQMQVEKVAPVDTPNGAISRFQKAIQSPTISYNDPADFKSQPFIDLLAHLDSSYILVDSLLEKQSFNYSRLYKWEGKNPTSDAVVLMGHLDVVPVDQNTLDGWEAPPFSGEIKDGKIYGRGAMDDKINVMALLEACEVLLKEGFQPDRTIYFAFGHDEEIGGENGAKLMAEFLKEQGVRAEFVLDEGGFIADGMIPGLTKPLAVINTGEKGYVSFKISVTTPGGHSSAPPKDNTIAVLAKAITKLQDNQFDYRMLPVIDKQINRVGPEFESFVSKMAFANQWLFSGQILEGLNAHTTIAPTIVEGGVKDNVIPTTASVVVNFRIMPGESVEDVRNHISNVLGEGIALESISNENEPSVVSSDETESFQLIEKTVRQLFPEAIVTPGLLGAGTDSKHFLLISDNVYRFFPTRVHPGNVTGFHGINEHIPVENYEETIQFSYQLMKNL